MLIPCIYLDSIVWLASDINVWVLFPTVRNEKDKMLQKFVLPNEKACALVLTNCDSKTRNESNLRYTSFTA